MEWLFGLAFLPALLCGVMCLGGIVLAAVGVRRGAAARPACCDETSPEDAGDDQRVTANP